VIPQVIRFSALPPLLILLLLPGCGRRVPDVIFLPTAADLTDPLLDLAGVGPGDVVADLGCGDGRIVVRAAKRLGARGLCVEIDRALLARSRAAADTAGVINRIRFLHGDLFEAPLDDVTVVALYLSPALNERLRPKLFRELAPGARVVSHNFGMVDWEPDSVLTISGASGTSSALRLWVIPADVAGRWSLEVNQNGDLRRYELRFEQRYQTITATASLSGATVPVSGATLTGAAIAFTIGRDAGARRLTGTVGSDTMSGNGWKAWRR
jgi:SAM-dependent methyltransferase